MTDSNVEPDTHDRDCDLWKPCQSSMGVHDVVDHYDRPTCWRCGEICNCALIAKVEQRGREMERAERLACICDTNPTTTDGPSEDCPQHGRPYVEAYDGGYRAGHADALVERGVGEPLDAEALLNEWAESIHDVDNSTAKAIRAGHVIRVTPTELRDLINRARSARIEQGDSE